MKKNKKILLLFAGLILFSFILILISGSEASDYTCKYSAVGEECADLGAHCGGENDPDCCDGSKCVYNMCLADLGTSCSNSDECNGPCKNNVINCETGECCGRHAYPCQNNVANPQRDAWECCEGFHCHIRANGYNYCEKDHTAYCGDGNVNNGEECDDGENNGIKCAPEYEGECSYCSDVCEIEHLEGPYCGDGVKDIPYEKCDDGNNINGDGCSSICEIEPPEPYCGDGNLDAGEECDDGNNENFDACRNDCILPYCGDWIEDSDEECDLGSQNGKVCVPIPAYGGSCEYCSDVCEIEYVDGPYCGDEVVQSAFETCELPNTFNNNFCSQTTSRCSGAKLGVRDAYGNCDGVCGCIRDPFKYSCVAGKCGAECGTDEECADSYCSETYYDYCIGKKLAEYNTNKIIDSTTVSDSAENICNLEGCSCSDNPVDCSPPSLNVYCVVGKCGAECALNSDCDDENPHTLDTCNIGTCGCEHREIPYCGNGVIDPGEECDDGNSNNFDACRNDCTLPYCGDGIIDPGEECETDIDCDDCNPNTTDKCVNCLCEHKEECGDVGIKYSYDNSFGTGIAINENGIWLSETPAELTKGKDHEIKYYIRNNIPYTTNNVHVMVKIDSNILSEYNAPISKYHYKIVDLDISQLECSSHHVISVEVEKINETDCNESDNYAEREVIIRCEPPEPECGDGVINPGEECDLGVQNGEVCVPAYGGSCNYCSGICEIEHVEGGYCGDEVVQVSYEECDDGNNVDGDGCSSTCEIECQPYCGDGHIDPGEECDDGNNINGDGCSSICEIEEGPVCGNEILEAGEECDDGNNVDGDGCSAECLIETCPVCGNEILEIGEECDWGLLNGIECDNSEHNCNYCSSECEIIYLKGPHHNGGDNSVDVECGNWSACIGGTQTRVCYEIFGSSYSSEFIEEKSCIPDFVSLSGTNGTIILETGPSFSEPVTSSGSVVDTGRVWGIIFGILLILLIIVGIVILAVRR